MLRRDLLVFFLGTAMEISVKPPLAAASHSQIDLLRQGLMPGPNTA